MIEMIDDEKLRQAFREMGPRESWLMFLEVSMPVIQGQLTSHLLFGLIEDRLEKEIAAAVRPAE
jgi:hypothetical protein